MLHINPNQSTLLHLLPELFKLFQRFNHLVAAGWDKQTLVIGKIRFLKEYIVYLAFLCRHFFVEDLFKIGDPRINGL